MNQGLRIVFQFRFYMRPREQVLAPAEARGFRVVHEHEGVFWRIAVLERAQPSGSEPGAVEPGEDVGVEPAGAHRRILGHRGPRLLDTAPEEAEAPQRLVLLVGERPGDGEQPAVAESARGSRDARPEAVELVLGQVGRVRRPPQQHDRVRLERGSLTAPGSRRAARASMSVFAVGVVERRELDHVLDLARVAVEADALAFEVAARGVDVAR